MTAETPEREMEHITAKLHRAIHLESAAIAPQTTPLIEAAKEAIAEINRLENIVMCMRNALNDAEEKYPQEWSMKSKRFNGTVP